MSEFMKKLRKKIHSNYNKQLESDMPNPHVGDIKNISDPAERIEYANRSRTAKTAQEAHKKLPRYKK